MKVQIVDLPNPGILQIKLDDDQVENLWRLAREYAPEDSKWDGNELLDIPLEQKQYAMRDDGSFTQSVLMPLISEYFEKFCSTGVMPFIHRTTHYHDLALNRFWVRASEVNDYQTLHSHQGVFSFVVWMRIPFDGNVERNIQGGFRPQAGDFSMTYTDICGTIERKDWVLTPEFEGTMLLFPSSLNHVVYPHQTGDGYRISIAGDISLNSHTPMELVSPTELG